MRIKASSGTFINLKDMTIKKIMYSLSKNKNIYKIMRTKKRKTKGWIISSKSYMDLKKIANNLMNDIPKVHLKRIDLTNTSSSMESFIKEEIDIDCSLSRNEILDESTEKNNQQDVEPNISKTNLCNTFFENLLLNDKTADNTEDIYKDNKEYNNVPDYEISKNSETLDDESNISIVSQSFNENVKSNITNSSLSTSQYSYEGQTSCDDTNLIVPKSEPKAAGKKYFCMYCKKLRHMNNFSNHLQKIHKNEAEVKKLISLPKGNSKRRAIIDTIRKESNFIFNTSSQYNTGELIVSRRSSKAKPASDFMCCPKCKGFFTKKSIWYHFRKCYKSHSVRKFRVLAREIQARIHTKACDRVRKEIFPILRDDDVSRVIRYDELVILRANELSQKFRNQRQNGMIRAELRLLGRYLISIKKLNSNITDFASIYQPRHYDSCILAIKNVAQFDPNTNKFKKQTVATRLGTVLKKLGNLLATEYIKRDDEGSRNVDNFLKLLQKDYGTTIDKIVEETVTQNKRHGKIELPSDNLNDLKLINLYSDFVIRNTERIYEQEMCL